MDFFADLFPYPGTWGVEYLGLAAGKNLVRVALLFGAAWLLDATTEGVRPWLSKRAGHIASVAISLALTLGEIVGAFFLYLRLSRCEYMAQGTANLSLIEVGLMLGGSLLVCIGLGRLFRRWKAWGLSLLPVVGVAVFCWQEYQVFPPRVRSYAVAWRECVAMFALAGLYLAATARIVWGRWRGWKVYVPKIAWLAFAFFWLRGLDAVRDVPRLARVSAGAVCGSAAPAHAGASGASPVALSGNDLQAAIDDAPDGAIINVPAGTYGPICTYGRALTLRAVDGPERTILDAAPGKSLGVTNRCATLCPPRCAARLERLVATTQRAHVLQLDFFVPKMGEGRTAPETLPPGGASVLEGFTLRGGHADCGGGALGGTLVGCVLERNLAEFCGAGAFGSRLERCTVRGNLAGWMGGGVWGGCTKDCAVEGNAAGDFGGGVWGGAHEGLSAKGNQARHYADTAAVP